MLVKVILLVIMKRLVLIDGHSVVYRSFFAFIRNPLRNSKGRNTSAIFGFANTLRKVLKELKPDFCAVVLDAPGRTFREEVFGEYKAQRPKMPEELSESLPVVKELVVAWGLKLFEIPGVEADDVIGTLTKMAREQGVEVVIVSSDKDMLQLVGDGVAVYDPWKEKRFGPADVKEKLGVPPEQVPDFLALAGDTVDNIPGVPGIGPKRALALLTKYGSLERALAEEERLRGQEEVVRLSRELARVKTDAVVKVELAELHPGVPDQRRLEQLYRELEFNTLLSELNAVAATPGSEPLMMVERVLDDRTGAELLAGKGFGIAWEPGRGLWVSPDGEKVFSVPGAKTELLERLLSAGVVRVGFDIKGQVKELHRVGRNLKGPIFDVGVGAWLLDPNRRRYEPADVVMQVLGRAGAIGSGAERAAWAWRVYETLLPSLQVLGLMPAAEAQEMPLIFVLAKIEERGVKVDLEFFARLERELIAEQQQLEERIWGLAGERFNVASPKQLAVVLFEKLRLPKGRRTKTGYSTGVDVLSDLLDAHPIVPEILRYRELDKLTGTYLGPLRELADPRTHRIHTSFYQTGTSTGRLASSEPNLQNIPIRGELGRRIRQGFVAEDGRVLISADYSQIELRLLAHFTGDERLVEMFQKGYDVHAATAAAILGIPLEAVDEEHRRLAKMVNYGLIYGMGDWGLSSRMGIPIEEARQFMDEYYLKFTGVAKWRRVVEEEVKKTGFVRTIAGRIRPVPGIMSPNRQLREESLRAALNAPLQGSAADIMKRAMLRVEERLEEEGFAGGITLQIHDELLIEVEEKRMAEAKEIIRKEMEEVWRLAVPLAVEIGTGKNWGEAH